jgi:RloB-like protein
MATKKIAPKQRVFIGCEGASEVSYVKFLQSFLPHCHFDTKNLGTAGDVLECIKQSISYIYNVRIKREPYERRFLFVDADVHAENNMRAKEAKALAISNKIDIIWQVPCHEALLLHHLEGQTVRMPANSKIAFNELKRHWPEYKKAYSTLEIRKKFTKDDVIRAATVEKDLQRFLNLNGF